MESTNLNPESTVRNPDSRAVLDSLTSGEDLWALMECRFYITVKGLSPGVISKVG